jgi:hypothetical protein
MILKDRMRRASPVWRRIVNRAFGVENKGLVKMASIAGGVAGNHTVADIKKGDHLVAVIEVTTTTAALVDRTSEFSIAADAVINNTGGTDTSADALLVLWEAFDDE